MTTRTSFGALAVLAGAVAVLGFTCGRSGSSSPEKLRLPEPRQFVTPLVGPTPIVDNPITIENRLPGVDDWRIDNHAGHLLQAYAGEPSVGKGEAVSIHVSGETGHTFSWRVLRMGWYGGAGA